MISIALYNPDIPQNTAAIIRLCACFKIETHIIEPCAFKLEDPRFKRVLMDYEKESRIIRYPDYKSFIKSNLKARVILLTTKAKKFYHKFSFKKNDILLFGRESAGVPIELHKSIKWKLKVPMNKKTRSMNLATSAAIVSSEALRQINFININEIRN